MMRFNYGSATFCRCWLNEIVVVSRFLLYTCCGNAYEYAFNDSPPPPPLPFVQPTPANLDAARESIAFSYLAAAVANYKHVPKMLAHSFMITFVFIVMCALIVCVAVCNSVRLHSIVGTQRMCVYMCMCVSATQLLTNSEIRILIFVSCSARQP